MPFIPAPNIMQVEMRATLNSQKVENRIMVNSLGPVTPAGLEAVAIVAYNWWRDEYSLRVTTSCILQSVVATDLTVDDGAQFTYAPDDVPGQIPPPALPNESSLCISLRSDSRGRSARGRFYWLQIPRSVMTNDNEVSAAYSSSCQLAVLTLRTAILTAGFEWVIVSYRHNKVVRPGGPVYYSVATVTVEDLIVDSQRRRKPGVGN